MNKESNTPTAKNPEKDPGKLLDRFKVRVSDKEFTIEIYNQDLSDDDFKKYSVVVNGTPYSVEVESLGTIEEAPRARTRKSPHAKPSKEPVPPVPAPTLASSAPLAKSLAPEPLSAPSISVTGTGENVLAAPMPGKILEIKTKVGDHVDAGQPLVILEAMKMENIMPAPVSGTVKEIPIEVGMNVNLGDKLVILE
ncbi:biotin/lipoyl-containing protein [[Eubacterium] cellulosolvens]